jgi:hypothetical protein
MGGQRWRLVFGAEMKDEMEPVLGHIEAVLGCDSADG